MVLELKLIIVLLALVLLAYPAAAAAPAAQSTTASFTGDLDQLALNVGQISNQVASELTDLNLLESSLNNSSASSSGNASTIKAAATRASVHADGYDRQLTNAEKSLWTIQSRYNPGNYDNSQATGVERRMSYIQNEIDGTRGMVDQIRILGDRLGRQV